MHWTVDLTLIEPFLDELDQPSLTAVVAAIRLLEEHGPGLGRPLVDTVEGSRHANMKELRPPRTGRATYRILFAFDPLRHAITLVAGNKANRWSTWYDKHIPLADDLFDQHLAALPEPPGKKRKGRQR